MKKAKEAICRAGGISLQGLDDACCKNSLEKNCSIMAAAAQVTGGLSDAISGTRSRLFSAVRTTPGAERRKYAERDAACAAIHSHLLPGFTITASE